MKGCESVWFCVKIYAGRNVQHMTVPYLYILCTNLLLFWLDLLRVRTTHLLVEIHNKRKSNLFLILQNAKSVATKKLIFITLKKQ